MQLSDIYMVTLSKCLIPTDKTKYSKWIQNDVQMKETEKLYEQHNRVVKNVQNNQRNRRTRKVKKDDWPLSSEKKTSFNQPNHSNSTFSYFFHGGREIYRLEEKVIYTSVIAF